MHTDTTSQEYLIKLPIGDSFFFLCFLNYCISFELSLIAYADFAR